MIDLEWLIKKSGIKGMEFVCGNEHGDNVISGVHIMDNPDTYRFFRKGELALTTGYVFKQMKDSEIRKMIETMKEKECSGIAFKVRRYYDAVPDSIVSEANKCSIPIITIPFEVSLSDLQMIVLREIFENERVKSNQNDNTQNSFVGALFDENISRLELEYLCIANKFSIKDKHCLIVYEDDNFETQKTLVEREAYLRKLPCTAFQKNGYLTVIVEVPQSVNKVEAQEYIREFAIECHETMKQNQRSSNINMGISDFGDYTCIPKLYSQATKSLMINSLLSDDRTISYSEQIMYHIMMDNMSEELMKSLALPLINNLDETLLNTLEELVLSGWKIKETSEKLFIHRNTLMFRKDKILEALSVSENPAQQTYLEMSVYAYRILKYVRRLI